MEAEAQEAQKRLAAAHKKLRAMEADDSQKKRKRQDEIDNMLAGILDMKVDLVCIDMFVDG